MAHPMICSAGGVAHCEPAPPGIGPADRSGIRAY